MDEAGNFRQKMAFIDHRRRTSVIIDHQDIVIECVDIDRTLTEGGWVWSVEERPEDIRGAWRRIARGWQMPDP
ncbi:hypothetical protein [Burkholderia cepacia]|uniref:hypothetical protein n=1 Tax=Burkholderia cepacia TaxID=292 RepID=UPI0011D29207|nr:hypothetical protein [Burkholderia cepacia]